MPQGNPQTASVVSRPKLLRLALILHGLGLLLTVPCLVSTTPVTMTVFFVIGIPLFATGFLSYLWVVIEDLHRHGVV